MPTILRRALVLLADALLFVYATSWMAIGGLALVRGLTGLLAAVSWATAAVAVSLAATIRLRAGGDAAVRALARLVLLFGAGVISNMGVPWRLIEISGAGPFLLAATAGAVAVFDVLYLWLPLHPHWLKIAAVLHFTAIYPRPVEAGPRLRRVLLRPSAMWAIAVLATVAWALIDGWGPAWLRLAAAWLATALIPTAALLTIAIVRASFQASSAVQRGRILGLLAAVLVALVGEAIYHAWPFGRPPHVIGILHAAAPVIASLLAVYAVFVRGGLSPVLVVRRTALYGVLSVSGVFTFALLDELLSSLLVARLGVSEGFVSAVAVAVVAVVFKPVYDRLNSWLNRKLLQWAPPQSPEPDAPPATTSTAGISL